MYLKVRGTVDFDASKPEHRRAVIDFRRRRAWADTNFRFSYDPQYGSVAAQVESKLLEWYINRDRCRAAKNP
jgi:hypothetical protein